MSWAVVTGASRGIGRAIAIDLAKRGLDLALFGPHHDALGLVKNEIVSIGRSVGTYLCDVRDAAHLGAAAAEAIAHFRGAPQVVVANAGIVRRALVHEMREEEWDEVVDVNLKGTFLTTRAFLPKMIDAGRGRIVAIGSISATVGTARQSAYCAAKWGTVGFVKSLAEELRGTGLQAMCVMPGSVDTDMLKGSGFDPAMQAEDVARTVTFLALDAPDAMNGSSVEMFGP